MKNKILKCMSILLEHVLDSLTHPFYVIDIDTYQVVQANSSAENSFQTNETTCFSLTHGRETPCILRIINALRGGCQDRTTSVA